jgi:L-threonylcarbamoyladenylate synthase
MKTLRLMVDANDLNDAVSQASIATAAQILREGGTVAFPTETVYGLGANALSAEAVAKIFAAKQRPGWDPLIVHVSDREMLDGFVDSVPQNAQRLIDTFWPGPLTLLLPRAVHLPDAVTAGRPLVGVRMPQHPVAIALIRAAGLPIAAPSANTFGRISPTLARHVAEDLDGRIDAILDAGETTHGLESTVIDPGHNPCIVYRPGVITLEMIRAAGVDAVAFQETEHVLAAEPEALPSPGVGLRHYAPRARLVLIDGEGEEQKRAFVQAVSELDNSGKRLGLMFPDDFASVSSADVLLYRWGDWRNPEELAQRLFAGLRWLDSEGAEVILCPLPSAEGIGIAMRDRLRKAARVG